MTIRFEAGGRVVGNAACNDYRASYTLQGRRLRFGKTVVLTTDRFCDQDTRETEERFIATLDEVSGISIAPSGSLVLYTDNSNRIVARRI
jgi:heat shock protein HslJ